MISTIMKISLLNLRRDKVAFIMTFLLPVIFFSIFAMIFGATDQGAKETKIKIVVADQLNPSPLVLRTLNLYFNCGFSPALSGRFGDKPK